MTLRFSSFVIHASSFQNAVVISPSALIFPPAISPPVPRLWDKSVSEVGQIGNGNNRSLNEEPGTIPGQNKNGKSYKCSGKPRAPETNAEKSKGLSRSPIKTFSLRKGRCNESAA